MNNEITEEMLTAFALNEISDADRLLVESYLAEHPEARLIVDDIREAGARLSIELASEMSRTLPAAGGAAVMARPARRWVIRAAAVAAAAALSAGIYLVTFRSINHRTVSQLPPVNQTHLSVHATTQPGLPLDPNFTQTVKGKNWNSLFGVPDHPAVVRHDGVGSKPVKEEMTTEELTSNVAISTSSADSTVAMVSSTITAPERLDNTPAITTRTLLAATTLQPLMVRETNGGDTIRYARFYRESEVNAESYSHIRDNGFLAAQSNPLSTFAVDVDTASYANVRRFLSNGQCPPADAVRVEEMVNYFPYDYAGPTGGDSAPVAVRAEVAECPWEPGHRLARVALKAKTVAAHERPACNIVFLIDVSGSMADENKLDLIKRALPAMVEKLHPEDHVSIVTYAGETTVLLPPTSWSDAHSRARILDAIDQLRPGGSTNGGAGITLAYTTAASGFITGGVNRVILATDGDFNVGITRQDMLLKLIERQAKSGVCLSVLGVGMGNLKDSTMEMLADHGHGNYAYLDSLEEARKVLDKQMDATLITVAKDVKVQIEFNPATVSSYRQIGYEDRALVKEDFHNDKKEGGDMGSGHTVTALYEIVPIAAPGEVDRLKYQAAPAGKAGGGELMTVKVRYKQPDEDTSQKMEVAVKDDGQSFDKTSDDFRFASAVAEFGMVLRSSPFKGNSTLSAVLENAGAARGEDVDGYRKEFLEMVKRAKSLMKE